ncbi:hypothetical protein S245_058917 [Arachis hypogaea]
MQHSLFDMWRHSMFLVANINQMPCLVTKGALFGGATSIASATSMISTASSTMQGLGESGLPINNLMRVLVESRESIPKSCLFCCNNNEKVVSIEDNGFIIMILEHAEEYYSSRPRRNLTTKVSCL